MAELRDSIRLTTVADLQALTDLAFEYKKLGLTISDVASGSRILAEQYKRDAQANANATKTTTDEIKKQSSAIDITKKSTDGLFGSMSSLIGLRSQLIGLFGAFSVGAFAKEIVDSQSQVEAFGLSMKNLLGQKYGEKLVDDLKKFTVETPLNFEQVIKSSNQLVGAFKAAGASSETIGREIPIILESLGNSAAALGGGDRLGRLTYAFSQVQATGRLMGTEVRQITETGFPLLAQMSITTGKSVQELQKDIHDGKVSFEDFKKSILSAGLEGGVFAGSMEIMANTVRGRLDKLSETFFFATARIGDALTSTAKSAIDFANGLIKALFGTDEAVQKTISYAKALTTLIATYYVASAANAAWVVAQKAYLVLKGQLILATETYIGMTIAETEAQIAAKNAALAFNTALRANPITLVVGLIGTAIAAYQLYNATLTETNEITFNSIKANDEDVKMLLSKQARINAVAQSLVGLKEGSEGYKLQVDNLRKIYPEYFSDLDKEKSGHDQIRIAVNRANLALERKIKLMVQEKLQEKLADRSAELKLQIAQEEIFGQSVLDKRAEYQKKQLELKKKGLGDEYQEQLGAYEFDVGSLNNSNKRLAELRERDSQNTKLLQKATNDYLVEQQDQYTIRRAEIIKRQSNGDFKSKQDFLDAIKKLDTEYELGLNESREGGLKKDKEVGEKALKYQADNNKQKAILDQANSLREEQQTRENQQKILDLEKEYAELRVVNAKGSQAQKVKALAEIEKKYNEDSANVKRVWDKKEQEWTESFLKEIDNLRKQYRASHIEDQEKAAKAEIDLIKNRYDLEIKYIRESAASYGVKKIAVQKLLLLEDLEMTNAEANLELIKKADNLRGIAAKNIAKNSKEIIDSMERQSRFDLEEIDNKEKLLAINNKMHKEISGFLSSISPQLAPLFQYNDAIKKSADANQILTEKTKLLADTISEKGRLHADTLKLTKEANEANQKAVEASNEVQITSYTLLLKAVEYVFNSIKKAVQNNIELVNNSYKESNRIYQEFVVEKRKADTKSYEEDLKYRLKLSEGNFDKQLSVLKEYLSKSEDLIKNQNIADEYASEFDALINIATENTSAFQALVQDTSLNAIETYKNALVRILGKFGEAHDGLSKEQEKAYNKIIANSDRVVEKLEWQRDNTVDILDQTIDVYKDKYSEQTRVVKEETDKQIDAVKNSLSINLDLLSNYYDAQGDIIRTKYGDILDNNVRYTDTAFEKQLAIWNNARTEQEGIIKSGRDAELSILKQKYESGQITLEVYLSESKRINDKYQEDVLAFRTKFYDDLQVKADEYYAIEKAALDKSLADNLLSQEEYDGKLETLGDIQKQRSSDIKSIVKKDRDDELAYLKTFYYDAKAFEEQKSADAIYSINEKASAKLALLSAGLASTIAGIEKQKRDTILSYNSQIFEENRKLALAQAEIYKAQAKAAAWQNPFTARSTIRTIEDQFAVIIAQILAAVNPFAGQILEQNILDNQVPVVTGDGVTPFAKGTDNLSASMSGTPKQGKTGGWVIEGHEGEAIFSKSNMEEMTRFLGKRPTRDEVIDRFKMGTKLIDSNSFIQKISPYVISKTENNQNTDVRDLTKKIDKLTREVVKRQQPIVNIDKNGIRTYLTNINSQIEIKNQKFSS